MRTPLHSLASFFQFFPKRSWRTLWPIAFLALGTLTCDILMPWFLKDILTAFASTNALEMRHFTPVVVIGVIRIVFSTLHAYQNAVFLSGSLSVLNKKMAWSCIAKKSHALSASASELTSLYTEATLTIEQFIDSVLWQTFTQGIYCFAATLIVIYLGGPLVLWAFLPFFLGITLSYLMKEKISTSINDLFSNKGEMGELCQDLVEGKEILHSYQAESRAMTLFDDLEERALPERKRAYVLLGLYPPVFEAIGLMALIVVLVIGYGVWHRYSESSAGAASVLYLAFLAKTLISVSPLIPLWSRFRVAVDKLEQIFTSTIKATDQESLPTSESPVLGSMGIRIDKLSFGYTPEKEVFNSLSFEFPPAQVTAVVGPNGSGKSTLMKLLTGELQLQGGQIKFGEYNRPFDKIAYLPQEPFLFRMSILGNLQLTSPEISSSEIWELAQELGFSTFLQARTQGLNSHVGARGGALSGGERQKISLLRFALRAKNAQFCLLDEPTSYIDLQSETALMKVVLQLCRGKTTIIASHRSWLIEQCDHVVTLGENSK